MLKTFFTIHILLTFLIYGVCQNRQFAQNTIDTLSSKSFYGRGYVMDGDNKAALFLVGQFKKSGLVALNESGYLYPFSFQVNTFPGKCMVKADGKILIPGKDYIVNPASPSINKKFKVVQVSDHINYPKKTRKIAIIYDSSYKINKNDLALSSSFDLKIFEQKKLTWSAATYQDNKTSIDINKSSLPSVPKYIRIKLKSKLINHKTNNVIGYISGTGIKDTFIVITAHYDHLGLMGKTLFPGANDNASGVAMMLDLASYFSKNPCKYSLAFIAFAGEEAGLIGSKNYTDNPWNELPLGKIKFLINLDLMGSGEKGMAVVNGSIFPDYFNKLQSANGNEAKTYLPAFKIRGKAANSDHYWFVERGVKGFFFYLMGNYNHYHDIDDNRDNLKLGEFYDKSFLLIRDFIKLI